MGRGSIQVKIISVILLFLIISLGLSITFTISNQKQNLLDAAQQNLAVNTRVLNHTIRNIMLSGEAPLANSMMNDLRSMPEFLEYEIYRRDGSLAFSNYETLDFVNDYQDRIMFEQTPRLEETMIDDEGFAEVLRFKTPLVQLDEQTQEMEYYFPILNYADCRTCHGEDHFIRGISHFRISLSDTFSKVGAARMLLTLFFLVVGIFMFFGILILLRKIIINPIKSIGRVVTLVGGGDLDLWIDMNKSDELGRLAGRINQMIKGLKASKFLELENTRIEARLEESRKYLDNIREGLLLLNPDYSISDEFSFYLKELFGREQIAGVFFTDFIYGKGLADEQQKQEIETFLNFLFYNKTAAMSMIMELNPLSNKHLRLPGGREIIINADFQRIYEGDEVLNVMVLFEDLTDIVRTREELEEEKEKRESELEQIAAILQLGPEVFEDFLRTADETIAFIETNREQLYRKETLDRVFRETHSLKGTARYLKFGRLENAAHRLESHFGKFRMKGGSSSEILSPNAEALIEELRSETAGIREILERFRLFALTPSSENRELESFSARLELMVNELAAELGKNVEFSFISDADHVPGLRILQPLIFHLIRNGIDHGIEDEFQRLAAGKAETAGLILTFSRDGENLMVEVEDDGRGIDLAWIEKKALELGIIKEGKHSPSRILSAMFAPGFSSREEVSEISGRGVGLDAVKADIKKLGGHISVRTEKGRGTTFILNIPLSRLEAES